MAEIPIPTHGYMRRDEFYSMALDGNLLNEWVSHTLRSMIYTERVGRCMSSDTFLCKVPWKGQGRICAFRWHMRYVRGVRQKEGLNEQMEELQLDTMALQRGMLEIDILKFPDGKERVENNLRTLRRTDGRWGILRTREEDGRKKPLISYA